MSIIVGIKGEGCVYLAADSQATHGESKLILDPKHGKLRQLTPQLAVGCTGNMNQLEVLVEQSGWGDYRNVAQAAKVTWERVIAGLGDRMEKSRDTGAAELPGRLLIAWKDDFIEVDASGQLIKPASDWHAIGSGADVARGCVYGITRIMDWDDLISHEELIKISVAAACECNIYCSLPVITAVTRV